MPPKKAKAKPVKKVSKKTAPRKAAKKSAAKIKKIEKKRINLALQGGGSHGAFTWGVLDEFLRDGRLHFDSITATSAGSMNAAVMLFGIHKGGREGGRQYLETFWRRVSEASSPFSPTGQTPVKYMQNLFPWIPKPFLNNAAGLNYLENIGQTISPYRANPYNINPLRDILDDMLDFSQKWEGFKGTVFISATNVHIGESRVFKNHEITLDVLMASAALPYLYQAVEIEGDYYWDGGYTGNPALWPLFYESTVRDLLIVHVNPIIRPDVPKEAYEIENRLNEITFNSSLLQELRAIQFVQKLLENDMLKQQYKKKYQDIRLHAIRAEDTMRAQGVSSKYDTSWEFLTQMRDAGRKIAAKWLAEHFDDIGKTGTVDIQNDYLAPQYRLNATMEKSKPKKKKTA